MFINFFLFVGLLNAKHPEQCLASGGYSIDTCWRKAGKEGVKRTCSGQAETEWVSQERIPDMEEKLGQLGSFTTNVRFYAI